MNRSKSIIIFQKFLLLLAIICVIYTTFITTARSIAPYINLRKDKIEFLASTIMNQPVQIKIIKVSWDQFSPIIQCDEVKVLSSNRSTTLINIAHLGLRISLLKSLLKRQITIDKLLISGTNLTIKQIAERQFSVIGTQGLEKQFHSTDKDADSLKKITTWLFLQKEVLIDNCNILIQRNKGKPLSISGLTIHLDNNGSKHHLTGQIAVSQKFPSLLFIDAYLNGNHLDTPEFKAKVYLRISDLSLKQWLEELGLLTYRVNSGFINANIWAEWEQHHWRRIQSQFTVRDFNFINDKQQQLQLKNISATLNLVELISQKWLLSLDNLHISTLNQHWKKNQLAITITHPLSKKPDINQLHISYLDDNILQVFKQFLSESIQTKLKQIRPQGKLTNISYVKYHANDFNLDADLENISFHHWQKLPAVNNLSGNLQLTNKTGALILKTHHAIIDFGDLFPNPITLTTLDGRISWFQQNNSWIIKTEKLLALNPDLQVKGDWILQLPTDDSGIKINLLAKFKLNNIKNKSLYLPSGILSKKLTTWLDKSIVNGNPSSGRLILRGNLKDFPFKDNKGKFLALSQINDVTLKYSEYWPAIEHLNAQLRFEADKMVITATSGNIFSSSIKSVTAIISELSAAESILDIKGKLVGDLAEAMHIVQNSPLAKSLGKLQQLKLNGSMQLNLQLRIPLDKDDPVNVAGTAGFTQATLRLPKWNIILPLSKGKIHFTEDTLNTSLLSGILFGKPVNIHANKNKDEDKTVITINGSVDIADYLHQPPYNEWFKGETSYQAKLLLANDAKMYDHLTIFSNLKGVTISLPPPFYKPAAQQINFTSDISLTDSNEIPIEFKYAEQLSAKLLFQKRASQIWTFTNGNIFIGTNKNSLEITQPGLNINGYLKQFDWKIWQPYLQALEDSLKNAANIANLALNQLNLQINQLTVNDYKLDKIKLGVQPVKDKWNINIENEQLKGLIQIAKQQQLWYINLDYLYLQDKKNKYYDPINIADIPSIHFNCNDMRLGKKRLGKINFSLISLNPHSKQIARLNITLPYMNLSASGRWEQRKQNHLTFINGTIVSSNISLALKELDFPASIASKAAQLKFQFTYPSMPYDLSLKMLDGFLLANFKNGQLLDVGSTNSTKLGFGRLLTFLSIKNITRHLQLDFSDLTQQGFAFDKLQGKFQIHNGNAYTKNFKIVGSIARINIKGKIGLANKDYDLDLAIIPNLTSSLPVIATIAGGPIAGAITWAADKILSSQVKKTTHYNYKMSGPWNNPVIMPIINNQQG